MFNDKKVLRQETVMHSKNNPRLKYEVVLDCSQSILELCQVHFFVPKIFTSMIYSAMSFPLKVLWVVKKLHHLASPNGFLYIIQGVQTSY